MIYLDTSFLVPLFREEAVSRKVADFVSRQAAGTLAVSKWACVEFVSHVSRDVRMGEMSATEGSVLAGGIRCDHCHLFCCAGSQ